MRGMAPSHRGSPTSLSASALSRPALFSAAKLLAFGLLNLPFLGAAPTARPGFSTAERLEPLPPHSPKLWIYLTVAVGLVLLGGAFAGLTIALMGQVSPTTVHL
jgi:metal transporter CNNM